MVFRGRIRAVGARFGAYMLLGAACLTACDADDDALAEAAARIHAGEPPGAVWLDTGLDPAMVARMTRRLAEEPGERAEFLAGLRARLAESADER
jgi:hypothetical protein